MILRTSRALCTNAHSAYPILGKIRKKVMVAMSGGVDSSVTAYLLLKEGHEVEGVYMRNWDGRDETGFCSADADYKDVADVCTQLGIKYHQVNFVKEYWNNVFESFVAGYQSGLTPNPDVFCNREIKFNVLLKHVMGLGGDVMATGHYARLRHTESGTQLLRALDSNKDQSYFLAAVPEQNFRNVVFPLGNLLKPQVREVAREAGLSVAEKRDSTGICFVGKRKFKDFIHHYVEPRPGPIVDLDGREIGKHTGDVFYTLAQGARLPGMTDKMYVCKKDHAQGVVVVAKGRFHPALYSDTLTTSETFWISGHPPASLTHTGTWTGHARTRYRQVMVPCSIEQLPDSSNLQVSFTHPHRAITPGQIIVFYDGDVCLGSGVISIPGPSYHELGKSLPPDTPLEE